MQALRVFQSLWAMELRIPGEPEPSMRANFEKAAAAGFAGLCIDLGAHEIEQFREAGPLYKEFGLDCMVNAFPEETGDLLPVIELACEFDARMVNVIGGVMPFEVSAAVPVVKQWMEEAANAGIVVGSRPRKFTSRVAGNDPGRLLSDRMATSPDSMLEPLPGIGAFE